jgi:NADH dehydrogenase [ubiquinone] 1 alpha subcomplex assembly factor 7
MADLARAAATGFGHAVIGVQAKSAAIAPQPLANLLREQIAREGPVSVHDYMEACLTDRSLGYYTAHQPIGSAGDFITAPEISQVFGELIGLWVIAVWQAMGAPSHVTVAELGPGRGTLMADALRAWRTVPEFCAKLTVALVETSPALKTSQREMLRDCAVPLQWYPAFDDVPRGPLILIANEFLDALPVRQFVRQGGGWCERTVALDDKGRFVFASGSPVQYDALPSRLRKIEARDGMIVEVRPAAAKLIEAFAQRSQDAPFAALISDYGPAESGAGDTLQAVYRHRFADPLAAPGETDLTAHVDFAALKETAHDVGLDAFGPMPQGAFLLKLGLASRCDRLLRNATPDQKDTIRSAVARLVDPRQMGTLFKMLALQSSGLAPPPPFGDI